MLVLSPFKMTTALSALLVMASFLPHVATSNVSHEDEEGSHDELDVTAPDVFTDKSIVAPTSDADPHDTLDLWHWNYGEDSIFAQDSDVFMKCKPNDTDQTCSLDTHATLFYKQVCGEILVVGSY
ncbi:hypothetical protein KXD40_006208 [Peronospora effusa]|nr:hypothetical protein KXD40_006208 [Peronospora effusa]